MKVIPDYPSESRQKSLPATSRPERLTMGLEAIAVLRRMLPFDHSAHYALLMRPIALRALQAAGNPVSTSLALTPAVVRERIHAYGRLIEPRADCP